MIEELAIRDLGVIGSARLPLGPGFTAITGETGAGKTMVVTALGLLLGARSDSATVRSGAASAVVDAEWNVPADGAVADRVRDAGGELDELPGGRAALQLSRSVSAEGRGRAVVGGRSAPVGVLAELGEQLVVVHGQSEQVRLRSATAQRDALDRFAGPPVAAAVDAYREVYRRWQEQQTELEVLVADRDRRAREADELRRAMAEIEAAAPRPGEDVELAETAERLGNLEELRLAAAQALEDVSSQLGEDRPDALGLVESARRTLERASEHDPALGPVVEALASVSFGLGDVSAQLSSYLGGLDSDSARELDGIQERRAELTALMRRHGPSLAEVIERLENGSSRLFELDGDEDRIVALTEAVTADEAAAVERAGRVTALRRDAAERLSAAVTAELAALAMPDARLRVDVVEREDFTATGRDQIAILLQPHPGAEPRPLAKGASGGELSRVMLALEVVIAATDPVPTFVFDEVDAGVGGASAIEIGRRLAALARTSQVVVVTHLAQVAAFAENHLTVVKGTDGSVTASSVRRVDGEERAAEMARLLSGLPDSASGLQHARELLELASAG